MDNSYEVQDYNLLKISFSNMKSELDNTKQELHECNRKLKIMESSQADYKQEIDMLQSKECNEEKKYRVIIKQLEQTIHDLRSNHSEEKQALENAISNLAKENEKINSAFGIYKESHNTSTNFSVDTTILIKEILDEPPEFFENQELKLKLKELTLKNENLSQTVKEFSKEIKNLKESYECKKIELIETNLNLQFLTDENMCIRDELNSLKNKPLNNDSKGNSLFAEVNDRRVYLQDKIDQMRSSYLLLNQEKNQLESVVHHLKLKNLRLLENWNADIAEIDDDNTDIKGALISKINLLEKLNEQYKKDLSEKPLFMSDLSFDEIQFFEMTLKNKNDEIKSMREQLIQKSVDYTSVIDELTQAKKERRRWKLEAMTKQQELDISINNKNIAIKSEYKERFSLEINANLETSEKLSTIKEVSLKGDTTLETTKTADSFNNSRHKNENGVSNKKESVMSFEGQSRKVTFAEDIPSDEKKSQLKCTIVYKPPVEF